MTKAKNQFAKASLAGLLCMAMVPALSLAQGVSGQAKQVVPLAKVLQAPIVINPASAALYEKRLLAAIDKVHKGYSAMKFQQCPSAWPGLEEVYYGGYNNYVKKCSTRSYSVQDQKNAGCQGSETVDQCTNKLFKYCLGRYEQDKTGYKDSAQGDLKTKIKKGMDKSDKIRDDAKQLSEALRELQSLMP